MASNSSNHPSFEALETLSNATQSHLRHLILTAASLASRCNRPLPPPHPTSGTSALVLTVVDVQSALRDIGSASTYGHAPSDGSLPLPLSSSSSSSSAGNPSAASANGVAVIPDVSQLLAESAKQLVLRPDRIPRDWQLATSWIAVSGRPVTLSYEPIFSDVKPDGVGDLINNDDSYGACSSRFGSRACALPPPLSSLPLHLGIGVSLSASLPPSSSFLSLLPVVSASLAAPLPPASSRFAAAAAAKDALTPSSSLPAPDLYVAVMTLALSALQLPSPPSQQQQLNPGGGASSAALVLRAQREQQQLYRALLLVQSLLPPVLVPFLPSSSPSDGVVVSASSGPDGFGAPRRRQRVFSAFDQVLPPLLHRLLPAVLSVIVTPSRLVTMSLRRKATTVLRSVIDLFGGGSASNPSGCPPSVLNPPPSVLLPSLSARVLSVLSGAFSSVLPESGAMPEGCPRTDAHSSLSLTCLSSLLALHDVFGEKAVEAFVVPIKNKVLEFAAEELRSVEGMSGRAAKGERGADWGEDHCKDLVVAIRAIVGGGGMVTPPQKGDDLEEEEELFAAASLGGAEGNWGGGLDVIGV